MSHNANILFNSLCVKSFITSLASTKKVRTLMEKLRNPLVNGSRQWRKDLKKRQRKRRRQIRARERDEHFHLEYLEKAKDPNFVELITERMELEKVQKEAEKEQRQNEEEAWLRRELIAQLEFKRTQKETLRKDNAHRLCQEKEWQAANINREEQQRLRHKCAKEFETIIQLMDQYLTDVNMDMPSKLRICVESHPDQHICEFFEKTNCCRFGYSCCFNHKRPILSRIILIKNFFQHPLLTQMRHQEYLDADEYLESNEHDLTKSFHEFCHDVWPELEKFGKIIYFRVTRNSQMHLRGHAFVEYEDTRETLRAFVNLQGRYYASKRLNVEFSNIKNWRTAVCGLSLTRKCRKGALCNYLHMLKNPNNKYEKPFESVAKESKNNKNIQAKDHSTPSLSWSMVDDNTKCSKRINTWRWSESPEMVFATDKPFALTSNPPSNQRTLTKRKEHFKDECELEKEEDFKRSKYDDENAIRKYSRTSSARKTRKHSTVKKSSSKKKKRHRSRNKASKHKCAKDVKNSDRHSV